MQITLKKSSRPAKKWMVIVDGKKIHFGQNGASDYTIHKDFKRKESYINRHFKREKLFWTHINRNLLRPSYWSRWLTWNLPSLKDSIKFIERKQKVKIIF